MTKTERKNLRSKRVVKRGGGIVSSVLNKAIDLLPVELHLPGGYQYCGPGTKLQKRLARGDKGINKLDEACKIHDIAYSRYKDSDNRRRADQELAERAWRRFKASDASVGEKAAAWAVTTGMKVKSKFGGGRKKTQRVKRKKTTKGKGLYLRPYKMGSGGVGGGGRKRRKKRTTLKRKKNIIKIPIKPLTNYELIKYANLLKIPGFKGVYMRDALPSSRARKYESAIVNLDSTRGYGTHWVCFKKVDKKVYYYDSFGNLKPPPELINYFGDCEIYYNYDREQNFSSVICGHLCLKFLANNAVLFNRRE